LRKQYASYRSHKLEKGKEKGMLLHRDSTRESGNKHECKWRGEVE